MKIAIFIIWLIAGILAAFNHFSYRGERDANATYFETMFWITYVVLMVQLI